MSVSKRHYDEILTDNTKIINFAQCKNCVYRDLRGDPKFDYLGYQKCICAKFHGNESKPAWYNHPEDKWYMKCPFYKEDTEMPNTCKSPFED